MPTLSPDGFVVLIPTLDIDSNLGPTQPSVYIKEQKGFKFRKKEFKVTGSLILTSNSFEIGKNHLLPYSFFLRTEERVPTPQKIWAFSAQEPESSGSGMVYHVSLAELTFNNFY